MARITIIGLGAMGSALARTLQAAGHELTVWNRTPGKAADLVAAGATEAADIAEAVAASPTLLVCIKSHIETAAVLQGLDLTGKTVMDLSTGGAEEARALVDQIAASGTKDFLIGIINAYPSGIGNSETAILCVASAEVWEAQRDVILALGGASQHVGTDPAQLAAIFAGLFTARQGFMFGMISGAMVCKAAGVPLDVYGRLLPVTHGMAGNYAKKVADTVPTGAYANAEATMQVYADALDDVLRSFHATGTDAAFPQLMRDMVQAGIDAGRTTDELTALVEILSDKTRP